MAKYRQLHTSFWQDGFVLDLTPEEKYFYLYLMTNPKTSQCGIYELPKRIIETETGYNRETIQKLLQRFVDYGKIDYFEGTKEVFIKNWIKYNPPNNTNAVKCVVKELNEVKNVEFSRLYIEEAINEGYILEGLARGLQGSTDTLPSNKIINNKEEVINNNIINLSAEQTQTTPYNSILNLFNNTCITLPKIKSIEGNRRKVVNTRWREHPDINFFKGLFQAANESDFLSGRNDKWKGCCFDWILKPTNMQKILEGNYKNKDSSSSIDEFSLGG